MVSYLYPTTSRYAPIMLFILPIYLFYYITFWKFLSGLTALNKHEKAIGITRCCLICHHSNKKYLIMGFGLLKQNSVMAHAGNVLVIKILSTFDIR